MNTQSLCRLCRFVYVLAYVMGIACAFGQQPTNSYDIYAIEIKTGVLFLVTHIEGADEYNPSWSNNGKQIAHDVLTPSSQDIFITDVKTGVSTALLGAEGGNDAAWSPNGQKIAFDRVPAGDNSVYVVPASGGTRTLVVADAVDAAWSPDSKRLVFHRPSDGSLRAIDEDGGNETFVVASGINPVWSPNGQWIAFSNNGDIWKIEVNMAAIPQGAPVQVTGGPGFKNQPSWSQNSKTIVFHSNLGGAEFDIYTIPAAGGTPTKLTGNAGFGDYDPSYSNNGQYVAFAGFNGAVPEVKLVGGATPQLLSAAVPQQFRLAQNYPNPFNPSTVIEYTLPEANFVNLSVYNSLGEEVAVLVRGVRPAGVNSVTFDAGKLPSGLYLYRLSAGSFVETRKLVVVK